MPWVYSPNVLREEFFLDSASSPKQNHLLAALSAEDYAHLLPDLEPIPMPLGWVIYESGGLLKYLYFPMAQTAVCNRHHALEQQLCRWLLLSLERLKLERRVCECYAVVKKEYDRLLPVRIPL